MAANAYSEICLRNSSELLFVVVAIASHNLIVTRAALADLLMQYTGRAIDLAISLEGWIA